MVPELAKKDLRIPDQLTLVERCVHDRNLAIAGNTRPSVCLSYTQVRGTDPHLTVAIAETVTVEYVSVSAFQALLNNQ
jgi:hypothetical protein